MSRSYQKNPYRGSRAFDTTCRNHGSCDYCRLGRLHANVRRQPPEEIPMGQERPHNEVLTWDREER